jgi:hypothetical protein
MTERELIDRIQRNKAQMDADLKALIAIQKDREDAAATNAAFLTRAELNVWHGRATERLLTHFPGWASDVVIFGPGGR